MKLLNLLILLLLAACAEQQVAPKLSSVLSPALPAKAASPNIFKTYNADGNAVMASGWTRQIDMSGVSFNSKLTATLITPRHVVMAKHYGRKVGSKVIFHSHHGVHLERTLIKRAVGVGDVVVGLLDQPVPEGYQIYPLPSPIADGEFLKNRHVLVTDQNRRIFIHQISRCGNGSIGFSYDKSEKHGWGKRLISGDSGNPSFLIVGRELVLVETHTTGGAGAGPFYGDPNVQAGVKKAVAQLDPQYKIRTVRIK